MGNLFKIKNTGEMILHSFTSDPTGAEGMVIYNSTDKKLRYYDGVQWKNSGSDFGSNWGASGGEPGTSSFWPTSWTVNTSESHQMYINRKSSPLYINSNGYDYGNVTFIVDSVTFKYSQVIGDYSTTFWRGTFLYPSAAKSEVCFKNVSASGNTTMPLVSVLYGDLIPLEGSVYSTNTLKYADHGAKSKASNYIYTPSDFDSGMDAASASGLQDMDDTAGGYTLSASTICPGGNYAATAILKIVTSTSRPEDSLRIWQAASSNVGGNNGGSLDIWNFDTSGWTQISTISQYSGYFDRWKNITDKAKSPFVSGNTIYLRMYLFGYNSSISREWRQALVLMGYMNPQDA